MATNKPDDFQQQAIEMLRAQQEAYVTAVKAWREALAAGEVQPPPSPEPTPLHMMPTATEMAEAYYAFAARLLGSIDLFLIWWIVSLAIGLGVLYKRRTAPIATGFLVVYGAIALTIAAVKTVLAGA